MDTVAKKMPSRPLADIKSRSEEDPRPLKGYAQLLAVYGLGSAGLAIALRKRARGIRPLNLTTLLLYGLATEHISRVMTKDSVTGVLRVPFTEFKEGIGEGEVNEDVVAHGSAHAVGELMTCPFCVAQWVATVLVAGSIGAPALTTAVVSVSAAARVSDFLQLAYAFLRDKAG